MTALLLWLLLSAPARAASPAAPEALEGVSLALPIGLGVRTRVLVPPAGEEAASKLGWTDVRFSPGPDGAVWFAHDGSELDEFSKGLRLKVQRPFQDMAPLEDGGFLLASKDSLGFADLSGAEGKDGTAAAPFQPVVALPVDDARLFPGDGGVLYVVGEGKESGRHEVWTLARPARALRKVFSTTERVSAAAGDGRTTYVALGRLVARLEEGREGLHGVFLHPKEEIAELAYSKAAGLFYATASSAGSVGPAGSVEFLRAPGIGLLARGPDLYVLLRGSLAVLRVEKAAAFQAALSKRP